MEASKANLLALMNKTNQFIIPIYQRKYSWTLEQCKQLWADIARIAQDPSAPTHFLGSVVSIRKSENNAFSQVLVIDGQQRLASISLLLAALRQVVADRNTPLRITNKEGEGETVSTKKLANYYLFNAEEVDEGDREYRLLLTEGDHQTFVALVKALQLPIQPAPHIVDNYAYFLRQVQSWTGSLEVLYQAAERLLVVSVSLEQGKDNPQLIFESLNSTGLDLSKADLIRNYLLMELEPKQQNELYKQHWLPMERQFGDEDPSLFDRFVRDYLTIKSEAREIPNIERVYIAFKAFAERQANAGVSTGDLVADLARYAAYYAHLVHGTEPDADIQRALADLNSFKVDVAYPFLLEVYDDYTSKRITAVEFVSVVRLIESYVFRRFVVDIPTNTLNKTFASLGKEVDRSSYLPRLQAALVRKEGKTRFPDDAEFRARLLERDIYSASSQRCKYVLGRLERQHSKEAFDLSAATIEHIMPQKPDAEWQDALGDGWENIHSLYLHTLGNLTLTFHNSEMGNQPFTVKRDADKSFKNSGLWLNSGLRELDRWDEGRVVACAEQLVAESLLAWPRPVVVAVTLSQSNQQSKPAFSLDTHLEKVLPEVRALFEQLRTRILALGSNVREVVKQTYIGYKLRTNFADVVPQKKGLVVTLNLSFADINDLRGICRDVTNIGHYGNGDVELHLPTVGADLDYIMGLIEQSYRRHGGMVASLPLPLS